MREDDEGEKEAQIVSGGICSHTGRDYVPAALYEHGSIGCDELSRGGAARHRSLVGRLQCV